MRGAVLAGELRPAASTPEVALEAPRSPDAEEWAVDGLTGRRVRLLLRSTARRHGDITPALGRSAGELGDEVPDDALDLLSVKTGDRPRRARRCFARHGGDESPD